MNLQEILSGKGTAVFTIEPEATLAEVVRRLVEHNCGSLVVTRGEKAIGIITERDILRATSKHDGHLGELHVADYMSERLITGHPNDHVEWTMGLMTRNRIRHLPIVEDGRLAGIISIGDVVKAQHDALTMENHYLKSYIQG